MMRTVWGDPRRWEQEWQTFPGCYSTGDIALKDEEGYITLLGRADDVLNVAGHRLGTAEVESALVSHPAVAEAAAIGLPDPVKGEVLKCFVQLRAGHDASATLAAALADHVRRELGPIATPAGVEFLDALPKTRSGKILRRYLKAREMGTDTGDLSTLDGQ
jgi:acetyl-CoA synthetase